MLGGGGLSQSSHWLWQVSREATCLTAHACNTNSWEARSYNFKADPHSKTLKKKENQPTKCSGISSQKVEVNSACMAGRPRRQS